MTKEKIPSTPAIRFLRENNVNFTLHPYVYEDGGGTAKFSEESGVDEHRVIKTLIMEDEKKNPCVVLMHGDMQVSLKELARTMEVKSVSPCSHETAERHSGYKIGGTSPFGLKKKMPVYFESTIADLDLIYINAGTRGVLASLNPRDITGLLGAKPVAVGRKG